MFKQNLHTRVSTLPGLSQKYFCALGIYRMTAWSNISGLLLHSKASLGVSALTHINKKCQCSSGEESPSGKEVAGVCQGTMTLNSECHLQRSVLSPKLASTYGKS